MSLSSNTEKCIFEKFVALCNVLPNMECRIAFKNAGKIQKFCLVYLMIHIHFLLAVYSINFEMHTKKILTRLEDILPNHNDFMGLMKVIPKAQTQN